MIIFVINGIAQSPMIQIYQATGQFTDQRVVGRDMTEYVSAQLHASEYGTFRVAGTKTGDQINNVGCFLFLFSTVHS